MSKNLYDKKTNREVKKLNRTLEEDVFGKRFWARQYRKARGEDGLEYYMYELCDREQPERNKLIEHWVTYFDISILHTLWIEMNQFIITSDFWEKYRKEHDKLA